MKTRAVLLIALGFLILPGLAHADLQHFLSNVNTSYDDDVVSFQTSLAKRFPATDVTRRMVILSVDTPADAVVSFWLHEKLDLPVSEVLQHYQEQQQHDWEAIATSLGLDLDSTALQALQRGDIEWQPQLAGLD